MKTQELPLKTKIKPVGIEEKKALGIVLTGNFLE